MYGVRGQPFLRQVGTLTTRLFQFVGDYEACDDRLNHVRGLDMNTVFISFHYDATNKAFAEIVDDLLDSHALRGTTGDVLAGGNLTPQIKKQIDGADAFIALLTRRDALASGGWATHEFCKSELQHARSVGKMAIAVVEDGVDIRGLYQEHECIIYDRESPLAAFVKLSRTIGLWKQTSGRTVKIQVMPEDAAIEMWAERGTCEWEYRLSSGIRETDWANAKARREPGGLFLFVQVPDDTMMIEVRVRAKGGAKTWSSDASPFFTPITFFSG